jgi:hypothetical protein
MINLQKTYTITDEPSGTAQILNSLPLQEGTATDNAFAVGEIFKDYFLHQLVGSYLQIITCKLI